MAPEDDEQSTRKLSGSTGISGFDSYQLQIVLLGYGGTSTSFCLFFSIFWKYFISAAAPCIRVRWYAHVCICMC